MNKFQVVGITLVCIQLIYGAITSIWFYRRRHYYPIKARLPVFCLVHQVTYWAFNINLSVWMILNYGGPCILYHWLYYTTTMTLSAPYAVRLTQLVFRYQITQEITQRHQPTVMLSPKSAPELGWFTRHQKYVSTPYLMISLFAYSFSFLPLYGFFKLFYPAITFNTQLKDAICPQLFSHTNFFSIFCLGASVIIFFISVKIRNVQEGLYLKSEFQICGLAIFTFYLIGVTPQINTRLEVEAIGMITMILSMCTATFALPVYYTYKYHYKNADQGPNRTSYTQEISHIYSTEKPRLRVYLQQPAQYNAFWKFLEKEFAVESLLFWKDINTIRNFTQTNAIELSSAPAGHVTTVNLSSDGSCIPSSNVTIYQMLQLVLKMYIVDGAPESINISYENRVQIIERISKLSPQSVITLAEIDSIFKEAMREILGMLENDSYMRFCKSEFYIAHADVSSASGDRRTTDLDVGSSPEPPLDSPSSHSDLSFPAFTPVSQLSHHFALIPSTSVEIDLKHEEKGQSTPRDGGIRHSHESGAELVPLAVEGQRNPTPDL